MSLVFEYPMVPAFYDFDPLGFAHNAVYIRWLEDARTALVLASGWSAQRLYSLDLMPALTHTEIDYKQPIRFGNPVVIRIEVIKAGKTIWSLRFSVINPETEIVYAVAAQSGCFVRLSTGRPAPMPTEFVQFCRAYQVSER